MKNPLLLITISVLLLCSCTSESIELNTDQELIEKKPIVTHELNTPPEIYQSVPKLVDQLPLFGGATSKSESDQALIEYLYKNLEYPEEARNNKTEGRVYVQFIVEKDGSVSNIYIPRGIGSGCDKAAIEVVKGINDLDNKWSAPIHQGKASRVIFTLPISFMLES